MSEEELRLKIIEINERILELEEERDELIKKWHIVREKED